MRYSEDGAALLYRLIHSGSFWCYFSAVHFSLGKDRARAAALIQVIDGLSLFYEAWLAPFPSGQRKWSASA